MRTRIPHTARAGLALTALFALLLAGTAAAGETAEVSAADDATQPFIVKIHADWCGACTAMVPTFEALDSRIGARARIVVLDVTDKAALARSTREADRLGIRAFFDAYRFKTGTVGVLDGATRETVQVLKGETDPSEYEAVVARAAAS